MYSESARHSAGTPTTRGLAGALSGLGHKVLATDVNEAGLLEAAKGWKGENVKTFVLDVRDRARWEAALAVTLQHFGKLDVLLNIAAAFNSALLLPSSRRPSLTGDAADSPRGATLASATPLCRSVERERTERVDTSAGHWRCGS